MELQKLLQDEIREGLYRITISGPRGDSEVSKVRIRPVEIKGKLLFQCQETVGTKEFHKNMTKDDVITRIRDWMNGTFKQMQLESDTCTASVLVSKKGTMTIKKKPHMKGTGKPVNLAHNRKKRYILEEGIPVPFLQDLGVMTKEGKIVRTRYDKFRQINRFLEFIEDILPQLPSDREITILEFIDMEHTPKNLLIRAVKRQEGSKKLPEELKACMEAYHVKPTLADLLTEKEEP